MITVRIQSHTVNIDKLVCIIYNKETGMETVHMEGGISFEVHEKAVYEAFNELASRLNDNIDPNPHYIC